VLVEAAIMWVSVLAAGAPCVSPSFRAERL